MNTSFYFPLWKRINIAYLNKKIKIFYKKILVDTGEMHPIQSPDREAAIGGKVYTFEEGLAHWNLSPEEIDLVIHTHLHNDHCENDYKCSNAEAKNFGATPIDAAAINQVLDALERFEGEVRTVIKP